MWEILCLIDIGSAWVDECFVLKSSHSLPAFYRLASIANAQSWFHLVFPWFSEKDFPGTGALVTTLRRRGCHDYVKNKMTRLDSNGITNQRWLECVSKLQLSSRIKNLMKMLFGRFEVSFDFPNCGVLIIRSGFWSNCFKDLFRLGNTFTAVPRNPKSVFAFLRSVTFEWNTTS